MTRRCFSHIVLPLLTLAVSNAWLSLFPSHSFKPVSRVTCAAKPDDQAEGRREFFGSVGLIGVALFTSQPALAAVSQEDKDKANIVKGYKRLQYLLENWEKETTVCKTGQDDFSYKCDRDPVKVMNYLGYRGIEDPLFKADKTMMRLNALAPAAKDDEVKAMCDSRSWLERSWL